MNTETFITPDKNPDRVPAGYKRYPDEFKAQYNMLLPDFVTCEQCYHISRCRALYGQKGNETSCQFHPNRYCPASKAQP